MAVIAVEIHAVGAFTAVERKTGRIQAGAKPDVHVARPPILLQQLANRLRARGFVAMNAGGEVKLCSRHPDDAAEREQIELIGNGQLLDLPAKFSGGLEVVAQDPMDVNGFAEVTAL